VRSMLVGTLGLTILAVASFAITVTRRPRSLTSPQLRRLRLFYLGAIACQAAHFAEELSSGFYVRFPEQLGLTSWPEGAFVGLNVFWLVVWVVSLSGLSHSFRLAVFPAWFLALAGVANGIAHPLLALRVGGYFPGLLTAPLVGVAGLFLIRELRRATTSAELPESV